MNAASFPRLVPGVGGLDDPDVVRTLKRLHARAAGDGWVFARALPAAIGSAVRGKSLFAAVEPHLRHAFIPVTADQGRLLYLLARARRARLIVEFGASFGISSIYLAAAARANGGRLITTELEPAKASAAERHLADAGLAEVAQVRVGDARESLAALHEPIDFLFLDGWKDLYVDMVRLLAPRLAPGAFVIADNIHTFRKTLAPYVAHMRDPANGFETATLPLDHGLELSVRV
jgi:predicted O-methyltransferase YrrM